jgi:hypothetical protein
VGSFLIETIVERIIAKSAAVPTSKTKWGIIVGLAQFDKKWRDIFSKPPWLNLMFVLHFM